ncbi:chitosanase [Huintestinicola butyrica]|uniref:chitosanase n=1 Tax=Huintestinicola butyrica TaxID=2981728 RepID=UPI003F821065
MKLRSKHLRSTVEMLLLSCVLFSAVGCTSDNKSSDKISEDDISGGILRKEVFALVSSAENSDTDYSLQYGYIEDIGDGRGYTARIIGFTTGIGYLPDVVELSC